MADVHWYLEHYDAPAFLFTPDADFPLICGEKGVFQGQFTSGVIEGGELVELEGGIVANAIPGSATALVRAAASALPAAEGIEVTDAGGGLARIQAWGKGGHASLPAGTVNAIGVLATYLLDQGIGSDAERAFLELERTICASTDGSSLGIAASDGRFGPLTCIGGTVRLEGGRLVQTVDSRYPSVMTSARIVEVLGEVGRRHGCAFEAVADKEPFYTDPASPEVRALLGTYAEYTGNDATPLVIGGGTYARMFPRACAFGPHDPSYPEPAWVGPEHGADEGVSEEAMRRALKIYIVSIARLMELDGLGVAR